MKGLEKQDVYVRAFPGKAVFEDYHGVPVKSFMEEAKNAVLKFQKSNPGMFFLRTARGGRDFSARLVVGSKGDTLCVNGHCLNPTKWGFDDVGTSFKPIPRLWFFDEMTQNDLNIECI